MHNSCEITQSQSKAIQHGAGPMLVLAGPGSGKTFVITHRVFQLIYEQHIDPMKILVITFTKAAAMEMRERFMKLCNHDEPSVCFGTFHAFFYTILKNYPKFQNFQVLKETDKISIIKEIMQEYHMVDEHDEVGHLISEISKCKNLGISPKHFQSSVCNEEQFIQIYDEYHRRIHHNKKIDFDDMLINCHQILMQDQDYLKIWQDKFEYILIDEFQDINPVQFEVVQLLSAKHHNLFVVGDDDQAIYGFRGSKPELMLNFRRYYPETRIITLEENFRSGEDIVEKAGQLIQHNEKRYCKNVVASVGQSKKVKAYSCENRQIQAENIIACIQQYVKIKGNRYQDIAIIYRTNSHVVTVLEKLVKAKIPFCFREKPQNIYETDVGKDLIAYIRYAVFEDDVQDFYRIMNKPVRYIKRSTVPLQSSFCKDEIIHNQREQYVIHNIIQLYEKLSFIKKMSPFAAINFIRKGIGYEEYLRKQYIDHISLYQKKIEILDEIQEAAKEYDNIEEWLTFLDVFQVEWSQKDTVKNEEDAVKILTMHASKGLEWKVVLIPDMNEGFIPHKKALSVEEIEEERRMLYVAMTRAKEYLLLFFVQSNGIQCKAPSRFLYEIFRDDEI